VNQRDQEGWVSGKVVEKAPLKYNIL
jgi:hypothetical protein